ncbi:MAG TPA: hypothetical protein VMV69_23220 [Pirellulales bacterium]|nr:hypothetical protein [Pirellulales bacterium]
MKRWLPITVLGAVLACLGGVYVERGEAKPPKPPKEGHPAHDLRKAYDKLSEVAALLGQERAPPQAAQLLVRAKELYRSAHEAFRGGDRVRANELAKAAHDAARGLHHLVRATLPVASDLPAPPEESAGPDEPLDRAYRELQRARDRFVEFEPATPATGAGREFFEAARQVYEQARQAYATADYDKAAELARAAEAWTHVGEHVGRADGGNLSARPERAPPPRADGPRRPAEPRPAPPPLN